MWVEQSRAIPENPVQITPVYGGKSVTDSGFAYVSCTPHVYERGGQYTKSWRTKPAVTPPELSGEEMRKGLRVVYKNRYDSGHEFFTRKDTIRHSHDMVSLLQTYPNGFIQSYRGHLTLRVLNEGMHPSVDFDLGAAQAQGRRAISNTIPTAPEVNLATSLAELKDGLPQLVGFQTFRKGVSSRNIGGEYLNYQFGVMPTVSDIEKVTTSLLNFQKQVEQMRRDSGKIVRRRMTLQEDRTYQDLGQIPNAYYIVDMGFLPNYGTLTNVFVGGSYGFSSSQVTETKVWFSGAYSYHLAEAHGFLGKMAQYEQLANKLLGTRITLETVWELQPWSWLIDWFVDVGTFMSNVSMLTSDSTVLRWGYLMHETRATRTHVVKGITCNPDASASNVPGRVTADHSAIVKRRIKATPYGFGVDLGNLSPQRWAILGALGLSKTPGTLR